MPRQRVKKETPSDPYAEFKKTALWKALEKGIGDLVENLDLEERTGRDHIVGYLYKLLTQKIKALR